MKTHPNAESLDESEQPTFKPEGGIDVESKDPGTQPKPDPTPPDVVPKKDGPAEESEPPVENE
jgi:hypothetical protein